MVCGVCFFFFKQKTAYEWRVSDWSSDVCSSDLRLVDVSQDCVVVVEDCGTERALEMRAIVQGGSVIASLAERILGSTLAEDIVTKDGEIVVANGDRKRVV